MSRATNPTPFISIQHSVSLRREAKKRAVLRLKRAAISVEALEPRWLLSGTSKFSAPTNITAGVPLFTGSTIVTDVTGDGIPDIVTQSVYGVVSVFQGNGNGTLQRAQSVPSVATYGAYHQQNMVVANVNGVPAILTSAEYSHAISVFEEIGGVWRQTGGNLTVSHGSYIDAMAVSNVNGAEELITANFDGSISMAQFTPGVYGAGFVGFGPTTIIPNVIPNGAHPSPLESLAVGNFVLGGDGEDVVAVGENGQAVLLPGKAGGLGSPVAIAGITGAVGVYNAGPGNVLILSSNGNVTPLWGDAGSSPQTAFTDPDGTIAAGGVGDRLAVGDFNGDGLTDFVLTSAAGGFKIFDGNDQGTYTAAGTYTTQTGYAATSVAAGDLTGDGKSDLVMTYRGAGTKPGFVGVRLNQTPSTPAITSADTATANEGQPFSFTVTTNGFPAATLYLEGGSLPQGLSFTNNGNGTATISGTANPYGNTTYNLVFTAKNSAGQINQDFTLYVNQPPTFTTPTSLTLIDGTAATPFKIKTTGGFPVPTITAIGLPAGLTVTDNGDGTATLWGTPTVSGVFDINVIAESLPFVVDQAITITIDAKPVFSTASFGIQFTVGTFGTTGTQIDASSGGATFPVPSLALSSGVLPAGLTFKDNGNGTAVISGTPLPGSGGTYNLKVTAQNSVGNATLPFQIFVAQQPVITSSSNASFTAGQNGSFTITSTGNSGFGLPSFSNAVDPSNGLFGPLPGGLTFKDNGNGTATISGTPAPGTGGVYVLHLVSDSDVNGLQWSFFHLLPAVQSLTLTINEAPSFAAASTALAADVAVAIVPTTIGISGGVGNITMRITSGALPAGLLFTDNGNGTATLTGTPALGTGGTYNLVVTAANPAGSATEKLLIIVNQAPTFTSSPTATFTEGVAGTFSVTTKGGYPFTALSVVSVLDVSNNQFITLSSLGLTFTDSGNGTATLGGTPIAGAGGSYQVFVDGMAGGLSSAFGIKLTILSRPTFAPAPLVADFPVGTPSQLTVSATDTGAPISFYLASGTLPAGLTFTDNGNGTATIAGTAAMGTGGNYTVQINAKNSVGAATNGPITLLIVVPEQPAITSADTTTFTVGKPYQSFTFTTTGNTGFGVPSFNNNVAPQNGLFGVLPAGVTFKDNGNGTATLTGTPLPGTGGVYPLAIESVSDASGNTFGAASLLPAVQHFTLMVDEAPTFAVPSVSTTIVTSQSFVTTIGTATGFATPSFKIANGSLPSGLTFTDNGNGTATIFGTPPANSAGVYNFEIIATNSSGNATLPYRIQVDQPPAFAAGTSLGLTLTHGKAVSQVFNLTGFPTPIGILSGSLSGLPPGLTLTPNSTGTELILKGTPLLGGIFNVLFSLVNADGLPSVVPYDLFIVVV